MSRAEEVIEIGQEFLQFSQSFAWREQSQAADLSEVHPLLRVRALFPAWRIRVTIDHLVVVHAFIMARWLAKRNPILSPAPRAHPAPHL